MACLPLLQQSQNWDGCVSVGQVADVLDKPGLASWMVRQALSKAEAFLRQHSGQRLTAALIDEAVRHGLAAVGDRRRAAGETGRQRHRLAEAVLAGEAVADTRALRALRSWLDSLPGVSWQASPLLSAPSLGVAGRPDLVGCSPAGVVLGDLKTGQLRDSHRLQVGGYVVLAEALGLRLQGAYLLRLAEDGFEAHDLTAEAPVLAEAFRAALTLYRTFRT